MYSNWFAAGWPSHNSSSLLREERAVAKKSGLESEDMRGFEQDPHKKRKHLAGGESDLLAEGSDMWFAA